MTVYVMISLPKTPYVHRIYMVLANPTHKHFSCFLSSDLTGDHLNPRRVVALHNRCTWALLFLLFRNNIEGMHTFNAVNKI